MRIVKRVPGSVLWMFASEPTARANLLREAAARGVGAERIVFADGVPRAEHLARQGLADLMLDSFPYNGGATTSIAIRAGVPIVTRSGGSFASRMGASLMRAADAGELVAENLEEYEEKAVRFALDGGASSSAAQKIKHAHTTPLYDPVAFTRHLERGLAIAVERFRARQAPDDIVGDPN